VLLKTHAWKVATHHLHLLEMILEMMIIKYHLHQLEMILEMIMYHPPYLKTLPVLLLAVLWKVTLKTNA